MVFIYVGDFWSLFLTSLHQNFAFSKITTLYFFRFRLWSSQHGLLNWFPTTLESSVQLSTSTPSSWLPPQHGFCRRCRDGKEAAATPESGEERAEIGRASRASGTAAMWKGSSKGKCRGRLGQRCRRSHSSTGEARTLRLDTQGRGLGGGGRGHRGVAATV